MKNTILKFTVIIVLTSIIGFVTAACDSPTSSDGGTPANGIITYTLNFEPNGGTGGNPPASKKAQGGDSVTLPGNTGNMTKENAVFGGWNTKADGTGTPYSAGSDYTMPNKDTTLYAKWNDANIIHTYTVIFDANGGSGAVPAAITQQAGYWFYLPGQFGLSKSGCDFGGWNTSIDGAGTNYSPGVIYTITGDITLYARWNEIYTVSFNSNGGSNVDSQSVVSGQTANQPTDPVLDGYIFEGWYNNSILTTLYDFSTFVTTSFTLYAKWEERHPDTCLVIFDSNGGSNVKTQAILYGSAATRPDDPVLEGCEFMDWYSDPGLNYLYSFSAPVTEDATLYAKWNVVYWTVSFNSNGGSGVPEQVIVSGQNASPPAPNPTLTGYDFGGWYSDAGLNNLYNFSTPVTKDMTLYAKWAPGTYTITYLDVGGGPFSGVHVIGYPTTHTYGAETSLDSPTKTGYTFEGWLSNSDGTGTAVTSLSATGYIANITLYAKWAPIIYTVTYDGNGSTGGSMVASTYTYDDAKNLTENGFIRTGYTFAGWAESSSGGAVYSDSASVNNLSSTQGATVILYAKWIPITYTITYKDVDGGTFSGTHETGYQVSHTYDMATTLDSPVKTGYIFGGWFINSDGTGDAITSLTMTGYTTNITLYAKWTPLAYTITYLDVGGGAFSGTHEVGYPTIHTYGTMTALDTPTKPDNSFSGWFITSNGTGDTLTSLIATGYTANIILYAKWTPIPYTITYLDVGGGTFSGIHESGYPTTHTYGTVTLLDSPTKTGYIFGGWLINGDGTGAAVRYLSPNDYTADIILYAKWVDLPGMVWVAGGSFEMGKDLGAAGSGDISPVHTVTLSGFYIGKYQITQAQYGVVMGINPSYFTTSDGDNPANRPVEQVSWYEAIVFCNRLSIEEGLSPAYCIPGYNNSSDPDVWIMQGGGIPTGSNATWNAVEVIAGSTGYRLPSEAQWEYVAKGGNGTPGNYSYSGSDDPDAVAWYADNSGSRTHEVGIKMPNGLDIYDMSGNVYEWCWDWYGAYTSGAQTNPTGATSESNSRVLRGGSWGSKTTVVERSSIYPGYRDSTIGFRLIRP